MQNPRDKAINKLISETKDDPDNIALILIGSSATGEAKEYSDIDLYLVVSDKKAAEIARDKNYFFGSWDPDSYFGIEVDGKVIGMDYLREAVDHANEAVSYSFLQAKILFSKNNEIEPLIKQIPVYPEKERLRRIKFFYAYVKHYRYVGEDAFDRNNVFHAHQCLLQLIYFSGRLILAHNRKLFPCHKRLLSEVAKCGKCPEGFLVKCDRALQNINKEPMLDLYQNMIEYFKEYDYPDIERVGYILEDEWSWKTGILPISEL